MEYMDQQWEMGDLTLGFSLIFTIHYATVSRIVNKGVQEV